MARDYKDYGFTRYQVNTEQEAIEAACFQAGQLYALEGHKKLPGFAEVTVNGRTLKVAILRSTSMKAHEFVRGWKAVRSA